MGSGGLLVKMSGKIKNNVWQHGMHVEVLLFLLFANVKHKLFIDNMKTVHRLIVTFIAIM